jgi:uncharacterized protein YdaU (DUF1376 family)
MSKAWMPIYWGDYLADTPHFTRAEHGSYLLLIAYYWCNGGLPTNEDAIRKIAKCSTNGWPKLKLLLQSKFREGWTHPRIDRELAQAIEISQGARERAMRRWHCQSQSQSQSPSKKEKKDRLGPARKCALPADWVPNLADCEFAKGKGLSERETNDEAQRFLDYATANNRKQADWHAAWRNWVTSPYRQRKGNGNGTGQTIQERARKLADDQLRKEELERGFGGADDAWGSFGRGQPHR